MATVVTLVICITGRCLSQAEAEDIAQRHCTEVAISQGVGLVEKRSTPGDEMQGTPNRMIPSRQIASRGNIRHVSPYLVASIGQEERCGVEEIFFSAITSDRAIGPKEIFAYPRPLGMALVPQAIP